MTLSIQSGNAQCLATPTFRDSRNSGHFQFIGWNLLSNINRNSVGVVLWVLPEFQRAYIDLQPGTANFGTTGSRIEHDVSGSELVRKTLSAAE